MAESPANDLAAAYVRHQFGDQVADVATVLLNHGPQTLASTIRKTEMCGAEVARALAVLTQHNCVDIQEDVVAAKASNTATKKLLGDTVAAAVDPKKMKRGTHRTLYVALVSNMLMRARFGKIIHLVENSFSAAAACVLRVVADEGRIGHETAVKKAMETRQADIKKAKDLHDDNITIPTHISFPEMQRGFRTLVEARLLINAKPPSSVQDEGAARPVIHGESGIIGGGAGMGMGSGLAEDEGGGSGSGTGSGVGGTWHVSDEQMQYWRPLEFPSLEDDSGADEDEEKGIDYMELYYSLFGGLPDSFGVKRPKKGRGSALEPIEVKEDGDESEDADEDADESEAEIGGGSSGKDGARISVKAERVEDVVSVEMPDEDEEMDGSEEGDGAGSGAGAGTGTGTGPDDYEDEPVGPGGKRKRLPRRAASAAAKLAKHQEGENSDSDSHSDSDRDPHSESDDEDEDEDEEEDEPVGTGAGRGGGRGKGKIQAEPKTKAKGKAEPRSKAKVTAKTKAKVKAPAKGKGKVIGVAKVKSEPSVVSIGGDVEEHGVLWRLNYPEFILRTRRTACLNLLSNILLLQTPKDRKKDIQYHLYKHMLTEARPFDSKSFFFSVSDMYEKLKARGIKTDAKDVARKLDLLSQDRRSIVLKIETGSTDVSTVYALNEEAMVKQVVMQTVSNHVYRTHGRIARRIWNVIIGKKFIEEKQIANAVMVPGKEVRKILFQMHEDGLVKLVEVYKTMDLAPHKSVHLWRIDMDECFHVLAEHCMFGMFSMRVLVSHQLDLHQSLMKKVRERVLLTSSEVSQWKRLQALATKLEILLFHVDDSLMCFRDFLGWNPVVTRPKSYP